MAFTGRNSLQSDLLLTVAVEYITLVDYDGSMFCSVYGMIILNEKCRHIGVGKILAENGRIYWTQMFTD